MTKKLNEIIFAIYFEVFFNATSLSQLAPLFDRYDPHKSSLWHRLNLFNSIKDTDLKKEKGGGEHFLLLRMTSFCALLSRYLHSPAFAL